MEAMLFRMMASKARLVTVPIWSCRPSDFVFAVSLVPSLRHCSNVAITNNAGDEASKKVTVDIDHGLPHVTGECRIK